MAKLTTQERINNFNRAFGREVNTRVKQLTVTERLLLGKLLFEEVVEYVEKGLGLSIQIEQSSAVEIKGSVSNYLMIEHEEGAVYDPIESADGLGDVVVVAYHNAAIHGFDLDKVVEEIDDSNMSKLDDEGNPIINICEWATVDDPCHHEESEQCTLIDPTKPLGKILKSANFRVPDIEGTIMGCWNKDCPDYGVPKHEHLTQYLAADAEARMKSED